jgi:putative peptidoglycan lipid II flippase
LIETAFGAFSGEQVDLVVWLTRLYLAGLAGHALLEIASRSYYAQQNAVTPLVAAALNSFGYILLAIALTPLMGAGGIAFAGTLAFSAEAALLLWLLGRRYAGLLESRDTIMRTVTASALGGLATLALMLWGPLSPILNTLLGLLIGTGIVLPFVWPELKLFAQLGKQTPAAPVADEPLPAR